jgi:hypothetical protein
MIFTKKALRLTRKLGEVKDTMSDALLVVPTEDMEHLEQQFSKLGVRIGFLMCLEATKNIRKKYPDIPEKELDNLVVQTFKETKTQFDVKLSTARKEVSPENRCTQELKNGKRCSFPRKPGKDFCTRHWNQLHNSESSQKRTNIESYVRMFKATGTKKPAPLELREYKGDKYKEKTIYLEKSNLVFYEIGGKYIAFGVYIKGKGIAEIGPEEIRTCKENGWLYEEAS